MNEETSQRFHHLVNSFWIEPRQTLREVNGAAASRSSSLTAFTGSITGSQVARFSAGSVEGKIQINEL